MAAVALNLVELPAQVKEGFARLGEQAMAKPGQAVPIPRELMAEWRKATAHLDGELNAQLMEIRRNERRGWAAAAEALQTATVRTAGVISN